MNEQPSHDDSTPPSQESVDQPDVTQPSPSYLYVNTPKSEATPGTSYRRTIEQGLDRLLQRSEASSEAPSDTAKRFLMRRVTIPMWVVSVAVIVLTVSTCGWFSALAASGQPTGTNSVNQVALVSTLTATPIPTATPTIGPTPTPSPTPIPIPTDTPTPPPSWHTVNHFSGSVNQQTDTIQIPDGAHIVWSYQNTDSANFFALSLYSSDGSLVDLLANYANVSSGQQSTYTVHGDGDYYLKIEADSVNWTVNVQEYY